MQPSSLQYYHGPLSMVTGSPCHHALPAGPRPGLTQKVAVGVGLAGDKLC